MFQDIQTRQKGFRCEVQVMNQSGHDVLTTFAPEDVASVEVATQDLADFWAQCIEEYERRGKKGLRPNIFVRKSGDPMGEMDLLDTSDGKLDLSTFEQVLIQPIGIIGG